MLKKYQKEEKKKKRCTPQKAENTLLSELSASGLKSSLIQQMSYLPAFETSSVADPHSDLPGEGSGSDSMLP